MKDFIFIFLFRNPFLIFSRVFSTCLNIPLLSEYHKFQSILQSIRRCWHFIEDSHFLLRNLKLNLSLNPNENNFTFSAYHLYDISKTNNQFSTVFHSIESHFSIPIQFAGLQTKELSSTVTIIKNKEVQTKSHLEHIFLGTFFMQEYD